MDKMEIWEKVKQPPKAALKQITGGRLKGKTNIDPQWRYQIMTEIFGVCGFGWKYEITYKWTETGSDGQIFAFVDINLLIRVEEEWSDPIPASGGAMLVEKESSGLHSNDEAFKMAITDALGTAMKMLGVAADIYMGLWDGTKFKDAPETVVKPPKVEIKPVEKPSQVPKSETSDLLSDPKTFVAAINSLKTLEELTAYKMKLNANQIKKKVTEEVKDAITAALKSKSEELKQIGESA